MEMLKKKMMELWSDEEGATMVEYGLMVALIAVVVAVAATTLGEAIATLFGDVEASL
ncbi:MAG: Flp family type IVb pilin [Desulfuromonadales bacterium]|nr:Flp family type IVb pilin [Desulfuromonadales bacterium]